MGNLIGTVCLVDEDWDDPARRRFYLPGDEEDDADLKAMARVVVWAVNVDDSLSHNSAGAGGSISGGSTPSDMYEYLLGPFQGVGTSSEEEHQLGGYLEETASELALLDEGRTAITPAAAITARRCV
ncbi:MAG: hypothetical protein F4Y44_08425 [Chloroflexi bacterium]|nr:hypothetical protein [Chloroflexota bacterium]